MSIIKAIREYLAECPFLGELAGGAHIDFTDEGGGNVGIFPSGDVLLETYFDGSRRKQYNFSLYARWFTPDDAERLENSEFVERLSRWLEDRDRTSNYPVLPEGMEPESIWCDNGGLFELDETGNTGLYQIQCHMIYERG